MEPADEITGYQQIDLIAKEALPRLSQRDQSTIQQLRRQTRHRKRNGKRRAPHIRPERICDLADFVIENGA